MVELFFDKHVYGENGEVGSVSQIRFACGSCGHLYQVPIDKIPATGMQGGCKSCGAPMALYPNGRIEGATPVQESAPPPLQEAPAAAVEPPPLPEPEDPVITRGPDIPPIIPQDPPPPSEFHCPNCGHVHRLDLSKLPPEGGRGACSKCTTPLVVYPDGTVRATSSAEPEPESGPALIGTGEENAWMIQAGEEETLGPFSLQEMKELVYQDRLPADRMVKTAELEWAPAAAFAALAPLFTPEEATAPGEAIGTEDECYAHADRDPVRRCSQCQRFLCEECLKHHQAMGTMKPILLCTACGGTTAEVKKRKKWIPFYRDMGYVLRAPFATVHAVIYFCFLSFLELIKIPCSAVPVYGWMAVMVLNVFQFTFYLHVIRAVAGGSYEVPEWPDMTNWIDMFVGFLKVIVVTLITILPMILIFCIAGAGLGALGAMGGMSGMSGAGAMAIPAMALVVILGLFYAVYLPICICIVAVFDTVIPALNPVVIFRVLSRIGATYFYAVALWIAFFIIQTSSGLILEYVNRVVPFLGSAAHAPLVVYFSLLSAYILGRVVYENEDKIGWY